MPLPASTVHRRDPARLPGRSAANDAVLATAMSRPAWFGVVLFLVFAILAIPALIVIAWSRMAADR